MTEPFGTVIASEGETRFSAALDLITVPLMHPRLAFVLSTVAGHLFGYEAARAIDGMALIERLPDVEGVIVTAKNEVLVSSGLKGSFVQLAPPTDAP